MRRASYGCRDHGHLSDGLDACISPSRPMALVRSVGSGEGAGKEGVQPATQSDADLSAWPTTVHESTVLVVQAGLTEGLQRGHRLHIVRNGTHGSTRGSRAHRLRLWRMDRLWTSSRRRRRGAVWNDSPVARQFRARIGLVGARPQLKPSSGVAPRCRCRWTLGHSTDRQLSLRPGRSIIQKGT